MPTIHLCQSCLQIIFKNKYENNLLQKHLDYHRKKHNERVNCLGCTQKLLVQKKKVPDLLRGKPVVYGKVW